MGKGSRARNYDKTGVKDLLLTYLEASDFWKHKLWDKDTADQ